jgi:hypothetical protein
MPAHLASICGWAGGATPQWARRTGSSVVAHPCATKHAVTTGPVLNSGIGVHGGDTYAGTRRPLAGSQEFAAPASLVTRVGHERRSIDGYQASHHDGQQHRHPALVRVE